jgi:NAD(P)-dependent dehydrogenase (short-subunit alcohol dehydrogenase family)
MAADPKTDRVIVITDASRGVGRATAQALARSGAWLVLAARLGGLATFRSKRMNDGAPVERAGEEA